MGLTAGTKRGVIAAIDRQFRSARQMPASGQTENRAVPVCLRSLRPLPVDTRQTVFTGGPIITGKTRIPSEAGLDIPMGRGIDEISARKRVNTGIAVLFYAKGMGIGRSAMSCFPVSFFLKQCVFDGRIRSDSDSFSCP